MKDIGWCDENIFPNFFFNSMTSILLKIRIWSQNLSYIGRMKKIIMFMEITNRNYHFEVLIVKFGSLIKNVTSWSLITWRHSRLRRFLKRFRTLIFHFFVYWTILTFNSSKEMAWRALSGNIFLVLQPLWHHLWY